MPAVRRFICVPAILAQETARPTRYGGHERMMMDRNTMEIGTRYNWRHQPDRLIYLGKKGHWHQFKKIGDPRAVWCEVLDEDLHMIEETTPATQEPERK